MIAPALGKYRLRVIEAPNGMQGFWLTLKEQPDVVVTDWNMEEGSGHYLLYRIKNTPATRHIPVIVYTAEGFSYPQRVASKGTYVAGVKQPAFSRSRSIQLASLKNSADLYRH